ncbi:ferrochelatase [Pseudomonas sp. NW5]|uniref:ferrochelatase n=1 Tax=Pseudomonas sp. NW5 TaxID=2934934 RepID=UPI00201FEDE1|nr:ferrochelatase [Pseudomonas sp. NW5]MCL7461766.1 ferrochelatase [Pseudomonas sp. NW5]
MSDHALLLVNLGSPASTSVPDVRRYLNQFLMDPYVIDVPWPLRRLIVSLILLTRPAKSAEAYRSIWWEEGSPLIVLSRRLQAKVAEAWSEGPVELAMRYGEPSIETMLRRLAEKGVKRVTLVPLYPQFADSTVTTVIEEARRVMKVHRHPFSVEVLPPFYDQPEYLRALADSVRPYLAQGFDHLLLSYHGLPERHLHKSDPTGSHCLKGDDCCQRATGAVLASCYRAQCVHTSQGLIGELGLAPEQWSVAFQSRLGKAKWIEPYTDATIEALAHQGVKKLLVMCPAFVADCIETLEEIGDEGREEFRAAGGDDLVLVPCLNDQPQWVEALVALCRRMPCTLL